MPRPQPIAPGPGQESVWDYPRPPRIEPAARRVSIIFNGVEIASCARALRVLETAGAPTYYVPAADIRLEHLVPSSERSTWCEWKGSASYLDLVVHGRVAAGAVWTYPEPSARFGRLAGHYAFFPAKADCYLDDERVAPQPGGFYGGWVTGDIVGPIKGEPGSQGW